MDPANFINNSQSCKLLVASRTGKFKVIKDLVENGADVNYRQVLIIWTMVSGRAKLNQSETRILTKLSKLDNQL